MKTNWDKAFKDSVSSICIQNRKPHSSGRNLFQEDKKEILEAAKKYGFTFISNGDEAAVSFVKKPNSNKILNENK